MPPLYFTQPTMFLMCRGMLVHIYMYLHQITITCNHTSGQLSPKKLNNKFNLLSFRISTFLLPTVLLRLLWLTWAILSNYILIPSSLYIEEIVPTMFIANGLKAIAPAVLGIVNCYVVHGIACMCRILLASPLPYKYQMLNIALTLVFIIYNLAYICHIVKRYERYFFVILHLSVLLFCLTIFCIICGLNLVSIWAFIFDTRIVCNTS